MSIEHELRGAVRLGEEYAGTLPAKDAVKVRPQDWHNICDLARVASDELSRLREANRKMHRRAQLSEAINQSVESILSMWCSVLFGPDGKKTPRYYEHSLFGIALGEIIAQRKKLTARALSEREGQDG